MTREEAIEMLKALNMMLRNPDGEPISDVCEALDMAIKALQADAVQGFRGGKIPPNEILNGTVLIPKHQWIEMERELAELKDRFESAVPNCRKCAIKELWEETEKEDLVAVVRCENCRYANECHKSVQYTRNEPNTVTIGYSPIEWCSRGERREE